MVGWVGPRTEGPFPRGFRPPRLIEGMAQRVDTSMYRSRCTGWDLMPILMSAPWIVAGALAFVVALGLTGTAAAQPSVAPYPGVKASGTGSAPQLGAAKRRKQPVVTWVGVDTRDGGTMVFLQSTKPLTIEAPVESTSDKARVLYRFKIPGAGVHLENTLRPVDARYLGGSIREVQIRRTQGGLVLEVHSDSDMAPGFPGGVSDADGNWVYATPPSMDGSGPLPVPPGGSAANGTRGMSSAGGGSAPESYSEADLSEPAATLDDEDVRAYSPYSGRRASAADAGGIAGESGNVRSLANRRGSIRFSVAPDTRRLLDSVFSRTGRRRGFVITHIDGNDLNVAALGELSYAITDDLEVGVLALPLTLAPNVAFGDLEAYGRYRLAASEKWELFAQLGTRIGVQEFWGLAGGLESRFFLGDYIALDLGVAVDHAFEAGRSTSLYVPAAVLVYPTRSLYVGPHTSIFYGGFDSVAIPLGLLAGYRIETGGPWHIDVNAAVTSPFFYLQEAPEWLGFKAVQASVGLAFSYNVVEAARRRRYGTGGEVEGEAAYSAGEGRAEGRGSFSFTSTNDKRAADIEGDRQRLRDSEQPPILE